MVVMDALGVKLGFGFSAGLFDYVLNFGKATRPLLLIPVGAAFALAYYGLFRFAILRFDLKTPGREPADTVAAEASVQHEERGPAFVAALGGPTNLREVGACTTRLRLIVADQSAVDEANLKALGARGILRPAPEALQVVLGPIADAVAMDIRAALDRPVEPPTDSQRSAETCETLPDVIAQALGGAKNIRSATHHHGRWQVELMNDELVPKSSEDEAIRSIARISPNLIHVLVR